MPAENASRVEVRSRAELRDWLAGHHGDPGPVWLVRFRKPHPDHLPYPDTVEELLCWGWIDSLPRQLDADRTMLLIAPRRDGSAWSALNKAHVARARASGAMTPAGEAKIATAMETGMWAFLDDVERLEVPEDLATALAASGGAEGWKGYPPSVQRGTLEWIKQARRPETRARRVAQTAQAAAQGRRPGPAGR